MATKTTKKTISSGIRGLKESGGTDLLFGPTVNGGVARRYHERIEGTGREGIMSINEAGTFGLTTNIWFGGSSIAGFSSINIAANTMRGYPFILPRNRTADRIAFYIPSVAGGSGSLSRCGIYQATSASDVYPSALVVDGGEFDTTTTGVKIGTINTPLTGGTIYWFVYLTNTATPTPNPADIPQGGPSCGASGTTFVNNGAISVAATYGALSTLDPFPAGGVLTTALPAVVALRFSA